MASLSDADQASFCLQSLDSNKVKQTGWRNETRQRNQLFNGLKSDSYITYYLLFYVYNLVCMLSVQRSFFTIFQLHRVDLNAVDDFCLFDLLLQQHVFI